MEEKKKKVEMRRLCASMQSSVLWSSKVKSFKMPLKQQQNSVLGPSGTKAGHHASLSGILVTPTLHRTSCLVRMVSSPLPCARTCACVCGVCVRAQGECGGAHQRICTISCGFNSSRREVGMHACIQSKAPCSSCVRLDLCSFNSCR